MEFCQDFGVYKKYETQRSFYLIDEVNKKYMRMPKTEIGRNPLFEDPSPHVIDAIWHDLEDVENSVIVSEWLPGEWILYIRYKGSTIGIMTTALIPLKS